VRAKLFFAGILIGLLVGGAVGWAAIPDSATGTLSGCYDKHDGALRIIDAQRGDACKKKENAVSWNQQGQRGPQGQPGPQGPTGPPGPAASDQNASTLFTGLLPYQPNTWQATLSALPPGNYEFLLEAYVSGGAVDCYITVPPYLGSPSPPKYIGTYDTDPVDQTRSFRLMSFSVQGDVTMDCHGTSGTPTSMDGALAAVRLG
jgi:hypothetical protein